MKLAEALLLRKQLEQKVEQLRPLKLRGDEGMFQTKIERRSISETIDETTIVAPRITLADVTRTFDFYAGELRKVDAAIQQANWATDVNYTEKQAPTGETAKVEADKPAA